LPAAGAGAGAGLPNTTSNIPRANLSSLSGVQSVLLVVGMAVMRVQAQGCHGAVD
jgi:hypothetical protein